MYINILSLSVLLLDIEPDNLISLSTFEHKNCSYTDVKGISLLQVQFHSQDFSPLFSAQWLPGISNCWEQPSPSLTIISSTVIISSRQLHRHPTALLINLLISAVTVVGGCDLLFFQKALMGQGPDWLKKIRGSMGKISYKYRLSWKPLTWPLPAVFVILPLYLCWIMLLDFELSLLCFKNLIPGL